jgi:hypothetical protein
LGGLSCESISSAPSTEQNESLATKIELQTGHFFMAAHIPDPVLNIGMTRRRNETLIGDQVSLAWIGMEALGERGNWVRGFPP